MRRSISWLTVAATIALGLGLAPPEATAKKLDDAFIRIEINSTDGDAGIHIFLDGVGWDSMQARAPDGSVLFDVLADNSVQQQGITEFFFESAEPSFDVQTLDELLALFPEGVYRFRGTTKDKGKVLRGKARLTHALPDGPVQVFPLEDDDVDPDDAVFTWEPVADPPGSSIVAYEVIVICEDLDFAEYFIQVDAETTSVLVPPALLNRGGEECKWEVLAIEESGNQTISESEFGIQ